MIGWIIYYLQWIIGVAIMAHGWIYAIGEDLKIKHLAGMMLLSTFAGWFFTLIGFIWLVGTILERGVHLLFRGLLALHIPQWMNRTLINEYGRK